tara:strand:+ start:5857 stop:7134 length:1278 start_codon:yes stop_codon:yes gene_type:complete
MAKPILLVPKDVEKIIENKRKNEEVITKKIAGSTYKFRRISMKLENLFYYTKNVRTTSTRKEYIKDNGLPDDFFGREKMTNKDTQTAYHELIFAEAEKRRSQLTYDFGDRDGGGNSSQTEEIYISKNGIIYNGNTRSAWWREYETEQYHSVNCLVFEDLEREDEIYPVINKIDPPKDHDIKQDIRWYEYILQAIDQRDNTVNEEKEARDANLEIEEYQLFMKMYLLAKEFLEQEFEGYEAEKFSTLRPKRGGGDGELLWRSFAGGMAKLEKDGLPNTIRHEIKMDAWSIIKDMNSESPTIPGQAYKAINKLFSDQQIDRYKKEFKDKTEDSGTLLDDAEELNIPSDLDERGSERLDEITEQDTIDRDKTNKNAFGEGIKLLTNKLRTLSANNLRSGYNRDLALEEFSKLEGEVGRVRTLLDKSKK